MLPEAVKSLSQRTIWTVDKDGCLIEDCPESMKVIRSAIDCQILKNLLMAHSDEIDKAADRERSTIRYHQ